MEIENETQIQYVRRMMIGMNKRYIADQVGLNYNTVCHIASGKTPNPTTDTVEKLAQYLRKRQ